ncbi:MAG: hypothetical protein R3B69_04040 [Candidatus Paceibacterota bacterium]
MLEIRTGDPMTKTQYLIRFAYITTFVALAGSVSPMIPTFYASAVVALALVATAQQQRLGATLLIALLGGTAIGVIG